MTALARVFLEFGSVSPPRATTRYCAEGLRALGALGIEAALNGIAAAEAGPLRLRRARLAARATESRMPASAAFWRTAPPEDVARVIREWRLQLAARNVIDPPVGADTNALPAVDSNACLRRSTGPSGLSTRTPAACNDQPHHRSAFPADCLSATRAPPDPLAPRP